ncbi:MAG: hypothetical protein ACRELD_11150 [Longimicrobiales bacterium]
MTQGSRTTESANLNHGAIREIMHQIRDRLTMPERATLAVGLVGHLATMMNRHQMRKLLDQLIEEAERVQDVPPIREKRDRDRARDQGPEPAAVDAERDTEAG